MSPLATLPRAAYTAGPWQGVRDSGDPTAFDPSRLLVGTNILIQHAEMGTVATVRPGFGRNTTTTGLTYGRAVYQYTKINGTTKSIVFIDQKMYELTTGALTEVVLGGGVSIAAANPATPGTYPIYCVTFADFMVVSDGVSKPWVWDGSAFTELTAASGPWYGRPFVYYGKLGGILASDRTTFEWSDEGDPFNGYSGVSPTQSWQLRQTSSEALNCMLGTNEGLYYWRDSSFDVIRGPVSDDFSTSGTVSSLSQTVGSKSPDAVQLVENTIFFPDQDGAPQRFTIGGGLQSGPEIWEDAQIAIRSVSRDSLPKACARYWPEARCVVFALPNSTSTHMLLAFDSTTGAYMSNWVTGPIASRSPSYPGTFDNAHALGVIQYIANTQLRLACVDNQAWVFQNPGESGVGAIPYHTDTYVSSGGGSAVAIEVRMEPGHFGADSPNPKQFMVLEGYHENETTGSISINYTSSQSSTDSTAQTVSISAAEATAGTAELRRMVGVHERARFLRPRWTHGAYLTAAQGYLFTLGRVRVQAAVMPESPFFR